MHPSPIPALRTRACVRLLYAAPAIYMSKSGGRKAKDVREGILRAQRQKTVFDCFFALSGAEGCRAVATAGAQALTEVL